MKNLLHTKKHEKKFLGLRARQWVSIIIIVLFTAIPASIGYYKQKEINYFKHLVLIQAYASTYKVPELAPLPEREANIALIKKIWGRDASIGLGIAKAESGYRTLAKNHNTNGTEDQGIFQINSVHNMPDMFNPTANISYAYVMFKEQGTTPWVSSQSAWGN